VRAAMHVGESWAGLLCVSRQLVGFDPAGASRATISIVELKFDWPEPDRTHDTFLDALLDNVKGIKLNDFENVRLGTKRMRY